VLESFGQLPRGTLDKKYGPKEPEQKEFRYGSSTADLKQAYSVLGWQTPGVGNPDELALDVLASIMGEGRSSRLYVNVVGPNSANNSIAFHFNFDDVGIFAVRSSFDPENLSEVDRRVLTEVERMRTHGPTEYELQLAKNVVESQFAFNLESVLGQAQTLSQFEARYGYEELAIQLEKLSALTTEDLQRVATKYLGNNDLTLYHYMPTGTPELTSQQAFEMVQAATADPTEAIAEVGLPEASKAIQEASEGIKIHQTRLSNGLTLVVKPRTGAPVVSTSIYFPGGRIDENNRNAGITQLMTRSLRKGTESRSSEAIDREIEFLGTQLGVDVQADYFGMSLDILAKNYRAGVSLLADVILNPAFESVGVEEEKYLQLGSIKRSYDSSRQRPLQLAFEALYGGHPYGLPTNGYSTSLEEIDAAEVRQWWESHVVSDGALIMVVGNIAEDEAKSILETAFATLPRRQDEREVVADPAPPEARLEVVEYRNRKQSVIVYAFPTVQRSHEDWPKLRLLSNITSGLAGTFFAELRGRRSLAYTVFATENTNANAGSFFAYLASEASKEPEARDALLGEIRRLKTDGFGDQELERAKSYFAGSTRIALQTNSAQSRDMSRNWFHKLNVEYTLETIDEVQNFSLEQMRKIAEKYFSGDQFVGAIMRGES
jgi:zinc protease